MNITANNVASKLFVAFVAAAMLFTLATPAKAATMEELQAQIAALMAQITALQGGSSSSSSAACTFTGPLTIGSTGAEVKCLQDYLTSTGHFKNAGGSTGTFGPVTQAAVAAWQTANGITPAAGYFGSVSQAKYNAMAATSDDSSSDDSSDDSSSTDLSGEASLDTVEVADGEDADSVEEGSENVQIAEIKVNFVDGDAKITRMDIALDGTANTTNTEADPWDVFQDVSLVVDGDVVKTIDASDKDNYLDEDNGSLRFAGLDIVAMEDEDVTVVVEASIVSSVDNAGSATLADWDVLAGPIRYVDADDVTTTDTTGDSQAMDGSYDSSTAAEFTIDTAGAGDDLNLKTSADDPESKTIALDADDNTEDDIFAFELDAQDSDSDVTLNEIVVGVQITGAASIDNLVNDFRLEIDGDSYDAETYTGTGSTTELTFDISGDTTIDADSVATAVLYADFENMDVATREGSTITATTTASDIDAEGIDDITVDGSEVSGETHSLRTEGLEVTFVSSDTDKVFEADSTGELDKVKYTIVFKVKAVGDAMYLDRDVTRDLVSGDSTAGGSAGDGFMFATTSDSTTGTTTVSKTISASTVKSQDTTTKYYIAEDDERTFTLNVTLVAGTNGSAGVKLTAINWTTDSSDATPDNFHTTSLEDYLTELETLFAI